MATDDIWVIGTDPPCPRCDYLTRMVKDIVAISGLSINVKHLAYTSEEAQVFAAALGLEPGTAKDVACRASVDVDWQRIHGLVNGSGRESTCCPTAAARWSPALDEALRPCERIAIETGIMMTPVLVIGGRLVHQGSVPEHQRVTEWINECFTGDANRDPERHILEVLGSGCAKCDTLYENVIQAVSLTGMGGRVTVRKRTDVSYFQEMGVVITPGLVIDGIVVSKGKVMSADQIADRLSDHLPVDAGSRMDTQTVKGRTSFSLQNRRVLH